MSTITRAQLRSFIAPENERVGLDDTVRRSTALSVVWLTRYLFVAATADIVSTLGRAPGGDFFWDQIIYRSLVTSALLLAFLKARTSKGRFQLVWSVYAFSLFCLFMYGVVGNLEEQLGIVETVPVADMINLSFYPAMYVAVTLLMLAQVRRVPRSVWLDGIAGASACASVAMLFEYNTIVSGATGGTFTDNAIALAYPVADVLIIVLLAALLPLSAWRPSRVWMFVAAALVLNAVGDFATVHVVDYEAGTPWDIPWTLTIALLGFAPWRQEKIFDTAAYQSLSILAAPVLFALSCVGVLTAGAFTDVPVIAIVFAAFGIVFCLVRVATTFKEIRALAESRLEARTDDLTELGNRRFFYERTSSMLRGRSAENPLALLIVDLDRFKEINDSLGHQMGDNLLRQLGPRLGKLVPSNAVLARLGGDEFAVVLDGASEAEALVFADRVILALEEPFVLDGVPVRVSASVGISLYPDHAEKTDGLLQRADVAMYTAKREKTGPAVYLPERDSHTRERLHSIHQLRRSIDQGRLIVYYQPQVDSATGLINGCEALVRMLGSNKTIIPPDSFLPLAEQAGLMRSLTEQVMKMVFDDCVRWRAAGHPGMKVSINLSVTNLLDDSFPDQLARELEARDLQASQFVFEITEGTMLSDPARANNAALRLRAMGAEMSLDDYGTGYASLAYLRKFPLDELKLDRSFVSNLESDPVGQAFVRSACDVAHAMKMRVVAEGIETEEVWHAVRDAGGDVCQGYFFSRPVPADEFFTNVIMPAALSASRER